MHTSLSDLPCLISTATLNTLIHDAIHSASGSARICLHSSPSDLIQVMLIALAPSRIYDYISDDLPGIITFTCLKGNMKISTIDHHGSKQLFHLLPSESIVTQRRLWRRTEAGEEGVLYMECIEGQFDSTKRLKLHAV